MARKAASASRRKESLSRSRIIEASIKLLDACGEDGLTFRALSDQLATGPGAIYWHIADKSDLLSAACDALVARAMETCAAGASPRATVRALALAMFDAIDAHPWMVSALAGPAGHMPMVRILEPLGQQVRALGVRQHAQWAVVSALLSHILGVGGRNATNGQLARARALDRDEFLASVANAWSQLDPQAYPFTRSLAAHVRTHDDRVDFLAGINLILRGIESPAKR